MDKSNIISFVITAFGIVIIAFIVVVGGIALMNFQASIDNQVVGEGDVIEFEMRPSGHWLGGEDYWVKLDDQKWYEISEDAYYLIEIGDNIIVHNSMEVTING